MLYSESPSQYELFSINGEAEDLTANDVVTELTDTDGLFLGEQPSGGLFGRYLIEAPVGGTDEKAVILIAGRSDSFSVVARMKFKDSVGLNRVRTSDIAATEGYMSLGTYAVCGHAFDKEGRTVVYCFALFNEEDLIPHLLIATFDTRSAETAESMVQQEEVTWEAQDISSLGVVEASDFANRDRSSRLGATYSLKKKRLSLFIPSNKKKSFVFNANTKTFTESFEPEVEWGQQVLYTTRAERQDRLNLGCDDNGGGSNDEVNSKMRNNCTV